MEENGNRKKNQQPSIPENYVSILQLQQRWIKGQERKQKEKEELIELKQNHHQQHRQQEEQEKLEEDNDRKQEALKEGGVEGRKIEDKHFVRRNRNYLQWRLRKKESENGGETEASVTVVSESGKNEAKDESLPDVKRKKKTKKHRRNKKKNLAEAEKDVVGGEAHAPSVKIIAANIEIRRDNIPKREKTVKNSGNAAADPSVEVERKLGGISIKCREDYRNSRSNTRPSRDYGHHNPRKPRNAGMVWVRKREAEICSSIASDEPTDVI